MGVLAQLRHALPKPLLFGIYGAVGGLVGALALGEALWMLLRPPAAAAVVQPPLRAAASPEVEVYQGGTNRFNLKVARDGWDGPVHVKAAHAPAGITVAPVTVPAGRSDVEVEVKAGFEVAAAAGEITLEAVAAEGEPSRRTSATLRVNVRPRAPTPPELWISTSPEVVVDQQSSNRFGIALAREGFDGPVVVTVPDVPGGVTVPPVTIPAGATSGEVQVSASRLAPDGRGIVEVVATGPAGTSGSAPPVARGRLTLVVRPNTIPPPALRLTASPAVELVQGSSNRFGVLVARDYFTGPIAVELVGLPAGVTATRTVVPEGSNTAQVELHAGSDAAVGASRTDVTGTGPDGLPGATTPPSATAQVKVTVISRKPQELKTDIMFVLDVTGSMGFAITGIRDGIIDFARELSRRNLDARVGLVGFRDHLVSDPMPAPTVDETEPPEGAAKKDEEAAKKDEEVAKKETASKLPRRRTRRSSRAVAPPGAGAGLAGMPGVGIDNAPQILFVERQIFTKNYRAFANVVGANLVAAGGNDMPESSLDALVLGACQPFRRDAIKVMILITDAPPHVPDIWVRNLDDVSAVLREAKVDQLHLVVPNLFLPFYMPLQAGTGGKTFDIGMAASTRGAFATLLPEIRRTIAKIAAESKPPPAASAGSAPPPPTAPAATRPPPPPLTEAKAPPPPPRKATAASEPLVSAAPAVLKGVQSQVTFAAASAGRLLLAIAVWTAAIAAAIALTLCAGQHHYLRNAWLPAPEVLRSTLGGMVAGLAGGAASQLLFVAAPGAPAAEVLFRVCGWTLLGGLAGLVLAFFVPNLRSDRGLLGGALGGAAGALGYLAAVHGLSGLPGGEFAGRVLGGVVLGFFIGLMVALAERMARKAWLEVAYGGGELRTVNLGIEPVSIGSNTRAATIYARGAAPVAFSYRFIDGKVKCQDMGSGTVSELGAGTSQQVGAVVVSVRTAATATPTLAASVSPAPLPSTTKMPVYRPTVPLPAPSSTAAAPSPPPVARPVAPSNPPPPPRPAAPAAAPAPAPAPPSAAADPAACPGCGRPVSGPPGRRYCIICDRYV